MSRQTIKTRKALKKVPANKAAATEDDGKTILSPWEQGYRAGWRDRITLEELMSKGDGKPWYKRLWRKFW